MTSADHHAAAALLLKTGESESTRELSIQLLELAAWHEAEAERLALDAVERAPASHIDGLTDGPVFNVGPAFPTDESMHS